MKVDLPMVRGMATRYGTFASDVAALDTTKVTEHLDESLPETDTGRFAASVGRRVDKAFDATGTRINKMAIACRDAADNYDRTEQAGVENLKAKGVL